MKLIKTVLVVVATLVCLGTATQAADYYVTDQLVLSVRETIDPDSPVVGYLNTDDPVEILAEEGDYAKISSKVGTGYVRRHYLTEEVPKQLTIERLEQQIARLEAELADQSSSSGDRREELEQLRQTNDRLTTELNQAKTQLAALQEKYERILANSEDLLAIIQQRDQLLEVNAQLEAETAALRDENESLLATGIIKWFLAGAGTLVFGWVLGKLSRKKRRAF